jgi:hypothetical protein
LIVHYEREHALFHAVRLRPTFINIVAVCQNLIARKVVIPRYFICELKMEHSANRIHVIQQKIKLSRNLLTTILDKGYKQLSKDNEDLNLSTGPHVSGMLVKNLRDIEELILNNRFSLFPLKDYRKNDKRNSLIYFDSLRQERLSRYHSSLIMALILDVKKFSFLIS